MYLIFLVGIITINGVYTENCFPISEPIHTKEELSVPEAFRKYGIVDDYIPDPPNDLLAGGHINHSITPGAVLSPLATLGPINIFYPKGNEGEKYAVFLLDIDTPTRENSVNRAYINGFFVNSPADNIEKGDVVVPFSPAIPQPDTGLHRYVGLLYKQNGYMDPKDINLLSFYHACEEEGLYYKSNVTVKRKPSHWADNEISYTYPDIFKLLEQLAQERYGFSVTQLAKQHDLGKPLAGNVFFTSLSSCNAN